MPLPRRQKSIYFLGLKIENARCFTKRQELHLVDPNGRPARWTLLVGDNGVGKSTLLQCLAWMRPTPYFPPGENKQSGIQPWLYDQDPYRMARLLRDGVDRTALQAEMVEVSDLASCRSSTARVRTGIELDAKYNEFAGARRTLNEPATTVEPFVITYAANRYMGHQNVGKLRDFEPVDLLHRDSTELLDAAGVLSRLEYSTLKGNIESDARLDGIKRALTEILPFIDSPSDIEMGVALLRRRPKGLPRAARQELLDPSKAWWGGRRGRLADRRCCPISVSLGVVPLVLARFVEVPVRIEVAAGS